MEGHAREVKLLAGRRDTDALGGLPEDPDLLLHGELFVLHGLGF